MARILGIGIATIDIIHFVEHYPQEDDEVRAVAQRLARGGNVTNTLSVLAQAGHQCQWLGTLADDAFASMIRQDLQRSGVSLDYVVTVSDTSSPVSLITASQASGSRTIVHARQLRELQPEDVPDLADNLFDWVHMEGRAIETSARILAHIQTLPDPPRVSLEAEKVREDLESLFDRVDYLFCSKTYWAAQGYRDTKTFLTAMHQRFPGLTISATDGAAGAGLIDHSGRYYWQAASSIKVMDSVGAGDAFNAALIHFLNAGLDLDLCLQNACVVAEHKCQQIGFENLLTVNPVTP